MARTSPASNGDNTGSRKVQVRWAVALAVCLAGAPGAAALASHPGDLAPDRMPPDGWHKITFNDPGNWTTVDVTDHGLPVDSPGVDASQEVLSIISSTTGLGNRILFFPAGSYYFKSDLKISTSNIRLHGDGASNTEFIIDAPAAEVASIGFRGSESTTKIPVVGSLPLGASTITVSDASSIQAGDFIRLYGDDWPAGGPPGQWWEDMIGQIFEVVGKSGNTLTLDMKLGIAVEAERQPVIAELDMVENVAVEAVRIHRVRDNADQSANVHLEWVHNARVRDIESSFAANWHIEVDWSKHITVYHNDIHDGYDFGGGGHGYGVNITRTTTSVHVVDNKLWNLRHHLLAQSSANHAVFSYNSLEADILGSGGGNAIAVHGFFAHNNLFEGNWTPFNMRVDNAHGKNGPRNTFFRNRSLNILGIQTGSGTTKTNIVGNVMSTLHSGGVNNYIGANRVSGTVQWGVLDASSEIPASLYTDTKPGILSGYPWPVYGPGVDGTWGAGNSLPATDRPRP